MGTDIYAAIEYKAAGQPWCAVKVKNNWFGKYGDEVEYSADLNLDRNYRLFALLGNVRNGSGFAGCDMGDGVTPISDQRGVLDDISAEAADVLSNEHSATWVSLRDLLEFDWSRSSKHRGYVDLVTFDEWERMREWQPRPRSFSGDVSGGSIRKVSNEFMREQVSKYKAIRLCAGWAKNKFKKDEESK